jgi:hypothetical protein
VGVEQDGVLLTDWLRDALNGEEPGNPGAGLLDE